MKSLRLYECAQGSTIALCGAASHGTAGLGSPACAVLLAAVFLQLLFIFTYNDVCDEASDRLNPRKRDLAVEPGSRAVAYASFAVFAAASTALPARSAGLLWTAALAGWLYSHPRTYLKSRGTRRLPWAQLVHALVAAGYFCAGATLDGIGLGPTDAFSALLFVLMIVGGNLFSERLDVRSDGAQGMSTTATLLGPRRTLTAVFIFHGVALVLGAALCASPAARAAALAAAAFYTAAAARIHRRRDDEHALPVFRSRYRVAFAVLTAAWLLSRPGGAAAVEPASPRTPVILISIDTLRYDRVRPDVMPNLAALRSEAVEFSSAYSQATWTLASHASLFYSQYPRALDLGTFPRLKAPRREQRLTDVLVKNGYEGVSFADLPFFSRAFRLQHDRVRQRLFTKPAAHFDEALSFLPSGSSGTYVFLHSYLVHHYKDITGPPPGKTSGPWLCPPVFAPYKLKRESDFASGTRIALSCRELDERYDHAAHCFDAQLGDFIRRLKENGVWDRALVAIISDHGESLCDGAPGAPRHGHGGHGREELLHVPWLLKLPRGRLAGRRIDAPVELVDVAPTILASLGLSIPATFVGRDRLSLDHDRRRDESPVYAEGEDWDSVTSARWRLVRIRGKGSLLFDLKHDPSETHDVSSAEPARRRRLLHLLQTHDTAAAPRRHAGKEPSRDITITPIMDSLRRAGYTE